MPEGGRGRGGVGLVPPEWRKQSGAVGTPAQEAPRRRLQTQEEMTARWQQLMDKRGHGELTPDEEREAADLEAQVRRMRGQGGMENAA